MPTRRLGDRLTLWRAIVIAVVVMLAGGSALWAAASAKHSEFDSQRSPALKDACAWRQFGVPMVLHRAQSLSACAKRGRLPVELALDRPVHVCRVRHASGRVPVGL